jgi:tetratricopeptide (TPR) repeat protein
MNKKLFNVSLALATAIVLFATSCSSSLKPLSQSNFKATPSPLETVGMEVPVTINGTFPEKWFHPNATVTITPVLKYAGNKELKATPYTYQGEKAAGNGITISKKRGGNFVMNFKFPYQKGMEVAELFMRFDAQIKNKKANRPDVKVADGVITTSVLADALTTDPSFSDDNFQRIIKEKQEEAIMFLIESAELRQSELTKEGLQAWKKRVEEAFSNPKQQIALEIGGYASPDGPLTLNETLAQQRLKNSLNYLDKEFKKKNISTDINTHYTEEDWEGFKQLVEASDLQDKELIIRILSMYTDPEEREQQIKNLSHIYQELAETVLPELRRARLIASINIIGKTDDEIMSFWRNDPKKLNIEELLYATTLTDNDAEKERIYQYITVNFPQDYRGWNNLGVLFYKQGNINKAEQSFNRAAQISPNAPEVNMNLALIAMINNDLDKAEELLGKASGAKNLNAALGLLYLKEGEYNKATEAFGNLKSNNAALAQLLVKDYSKASQTLAAIPNPDATTAYLAAIVAARTNNFNDVLTNLQTAIQRDKSMAQKAANDLEFAKYRTNSEFVSLIQ